MSASIAFTVSYVAMWILLLVTAVLVLLLYRHFGLMSMDSLEGVQRDGLPIGDYAPQFRGVTADGEAVTMFPGRAGRAFILFASPECAPCKKVAPYINELERARRSGLDIDVTVVAAGNQDVAVRMADNFGTSFRTIADDRTGVFDAYRVRVTPFAFLVDDNRRIRAKGLCGDGHRLGSLLHTAGMSDVAAVLESTIELDRSTSDTFENVLRQEEAAI